MPLEYQDDILFVETGVDMRDPSENLEISEQHKLRKLSNAIKLRLILLKPGLYNV